MRASSTLVCLIGVTLSVAPIFSCAWAQQPNQQATLLMEMQALRSEIAELRDMVERQQYQLRQMQASLPAGAARTAGPVDNVPGAAVLQAPDLNTVPAPQNVALENQYADSQPDIAAPGSSDYPAEEVAPAFAENEADFYQPTLPPEQSSENLSDTMADGVVIEERLIDQNTSASVANARNRFPPVEERTIGQPTYQAESGQAESGTAPQVSPNTQINGVLAPTATANTTGVIAVPDDNRAVNQQTYPNPRTVTSGPVAQTIEGADSPVYQQPAQSSANDMPVADVAPIPAVISEQDYYQQGFELLKQSKHSQAVEVFKQQIGNYPQGGLADDAHYWIAESMYVNRSLDISKQYFRAIIDGFQQSPRLPDAMLKTAYIEQEQGNRIEARILLQEIIQYHPRSNAAISAKNRLAELE